MYVEIETKATTVKPVTSVKFNADYDITDVLTRFGNWSRKGFYKRQGTLSLYNTQKQKHKELCSDDDALMINDAILSLLALNTPNSRMIYDVIIFIYFGEKSIITDYIPTTGMAQELKQRHLAGNATMISSKDFTKSEIYLVKPLTVQDLITKLDMNWNAIDKLKKSGEDFLIGYFSALKSATGKELELLQNTRLLK